MSGLELCIGDDDGGGLCPNSCLLGLLIVIFWFSVEIRTGGGGGDSEFF